MRQTSLNLQTPNPNYVSFDENTFLIFGREVVLFRKH